MILRKQSRLVQYIWPCTKNRYFTVPCHFLAGKCFTYFWLTSNLKIIFFTSSWRKYFSFKSWFMVLKFIKILFNHLFCKVSFIKLSFPSGNISLVLDGYLFLLQLSTSNKVTVIFDRHKFWFKYCLGLLTNSKII